MKIILSDSHKICSIRDFFFIWKKKKEVKLRGLVTRSFPGDWYRHFSVMVTNVVFFRLERDSGIGFSGFIVLSVNFFSSFLCA